mmetsp:Transcript_7987/g.14589  ORF Transcript_7987/g.14589 Transcript_7987/m.14589 type:complete len:390 (+) Transcript_7987:77-1246(+)
MTSMKPNAAARVPDAEQPNESTSLLDKKQPEAKGFDMSGFKMPQMTRIWLMVVLLMAFGVISLKFIEGLSVVTAVYVIVQMMTTVGYGDFTVNGDVPKLFCAFYAVLLLVFGAYAFDKVFDCMRNRTAEAMREGLRRDEKIGSSLPRALTGEVATPHRELAFKAQPSSRHDEDRSLLDGKVGESCMKFLMASAISLSFVVFGTVFYATYERCTCSYGVSKVEGCKPDPVEACIATGGYQKSWIASFYMSVITLTTIGFGDHSPRSALGRMVGSVWMLLGVAAVANWFNCCSKLFFDYGQRKKLKVSANVNEELFNKIDKDGSGYLSRAEFRGYYLVKNGLCTEEDLDLIDKHFERLQAFAGRRDISFENIKQYWHSEFRHPSVHSTPRQ